MREIVVIAHDIRSTHNVGSLLRTAEGLGVKHVYLTGYTPYPSHEKDLRLPHLASKINKDIEKTALGAETSQAWTHHEPINELLEKLKNEGFKIIALEQTKSAVPLPEFKFPEKIAILLGSEVEGINDGLLKTVPDHVVIPMFGKKESFNVVQAAAMIMYAARFS